MLKKYRINKIEKYKRKLKDNGFKNEDIESLAKIYNICSRLTNIIILSITILILSISFILVAHYSKMDWLEKNEVLVTKISSITLGISTLIYQILTLYLFIKVILNKSLIVKNKIKIWAFFSLIPGIGFIFFFIMKRIIAWIYHFKK